MNDLDSAMVDSEEEGIDPFQFQETLLQIKDTILLIGNWKNLPSLHLDAKCSIRDVFII